jgi:uncharacterized protein (TIGR00297 family)
MDRSVARVALGLAAAGVISAVARRAHALSSGGAAAATIVGGTVVAASGTRGGAGLMTFFLSSTLLGWLPAAHEIEQHRGNERDAIQVIANGGVAAILAAASSIAPERVRPLLMAGLGGAIAAATADTWATEIGSRSRQRPRSIATLNPVAPGASGGVTLAGLAASAAGASLIASVTSGDLRHRQGHMLIQLVSVSAGGFTGALADSVLGAIVQEIRFCDRCLLESEQHVHHCGTRTHRIRGVWWCNNDMVNAIATVVGAAAAVLLNGVGRKRARTLAAREGTGTTNNSHVAHFVTQGRATVEYSARATT